MENDGVTGAAAVATDPQNPNPSGKTGGDAGKDKGNEQLTALQARITNLEKQNRELAESERYWADQARAAGEVEEVEEIRPQEVDPLAGDTPEKLVDELSSQGAAALSKRGFVSRKEAEEMARRVATEVAEQVAGRHVAGARQALESDAELVRDFPELNNEKSPMFVKTAEVFKGMVARDARMKNSPAALLSAAKIAKLEIAAEDRANGGGRGSRNDDDEPAHETEVERQARIAAQAGDRGHGRRTEEEDLDVDGGGLSARQKLIIDKMGVTEADYVKTAQNGIRMGRSVGLTPQGGRRRAN
jgi:hypothetical protein